MTETIARRTFAPQAVDEEFKQLAFEYLRAIAAGVAGTFGPSCEVVLHDFCDLDHSIVWIEGNVTNRRIGGSITDLGLKLIQSEETDDVLNYTTRALDGKTLKSSSIFLADSMGHVFGAMCINVDITAFLTAERVLKAFTYREDNQQFDETFADDIQEILESLMSETENELGKPISLMSKDERVELVKRLEAKGAFRVKKAVPVIAELLGVSRYTVYNYLNEAHAQTGGDVGMIVDE